MRFFYLTAIGLVLTFHPTAQAGIIVSSGYYDLSPAASGGGPPLPTPWIGSPNTSFYGSNSDLSNAVASDPDISALLIQNTGIANVTLSALSLSPSGMDVLARHSRPTATFLRQPWPCCPGKTTSSRWVMAPTRG